MREGAAPDAAHNFRRLHMPLDPGDILFTSNLTDTDSGGSGASEQFSFIATTSIAAGEIITFHSPEDFGAAFGGLGNSTFSFTVGLTGLSPLDRVTLSESGDTISIITDPSGGSVSGVSHTGPASGWSISGNDPIIAASGGEVIAAINNGGNWDDNFSIKGLSRAAIDAYTGDPSPIIDNIAADTGSDDNAMFSGSNITDIDDPAFWVNDGASQNHASPDILGTTFTSQDADISCFAAGTWIATPQGDVAVETLSIGDMVVTAEGAQVPVLWLAKQTVTKMFAGDRARLVRIRAGVLGNHSDLLVTGDHGMVVDGYVVNASALVAGEGVDWLSLEDTPERLTVYHIETEAHDTVLANGAAAETFIDYAGRRQFDNYAEYAGLYGENRSITEDPMPRVSAARHLPDAVKRRLGLLAPTACSA
jgi:hypothetical protein